MIRLLARLAFWRRWSTARKSMGLGFLLTLAMLLANLMSLNEGSRLRSLDFLFFLRGPVPPQANVVIVAIDNESFNEMGAFPWPRKHHARLINQIAKGHPKAIVFDVLMTEDSSFGHDQDEALASAARSAGNVILGSEVVHVVNANFEYDELKLPIPVLRKAIYSPGLVNTPLDSDAFVRRAQLFRSVQSEKHFSLAIEALRKTLGVGRGEIDVEPGRMKFGDHDIPLDQQGYMLINYCGPAQTFKTIPYYQVYKGMTDPSVFKDAIVFVGATIIELHDVFHTPYSWSPFADDRTVTQVPGVEIHANVIDTILYNRYIREPFGLWTLLEVVALGLFVSWMAIRARIWVSLVGTMVLAFGLTAFSVWAFISRSMFVDYVTPIYTVGLVFLGTTVYRASVELREKQKIRGTFARYVSPHVLTTVLTHPPELGGVRREATVLFSDVRGFTSMSEKLTAHEVVEILNEYLTQMVDVVLRHEGTLDKFVGDAVMAVYGSPMDQPDQALRAVSTAWHMHLRHVALKEKWLRDGKVPFEIGIGVNSGDVVAGNMGSPNRMEFTVIGDNVNLAARLESSTKELGAKIVISGTTYERVKEFVEVKAHEPIHVKGKAAAIEVFELRGLDIPRVAAVLKLPPEFHHAPEGLGDAPTKAS